ncbi:MAG: polyphosphate polymerase domain-containing protein [Christensenellaceae bacterium]|jgi:hypothetical protein|nr:polyphosphate polymerase domain-containing protein [Christensenellaceae bacterium]
MTANNPSRQAPAETLRHELKYHISLGSAGILSSLLGNTLSIDENADQNGEYKIRSLYFDDALNSAMSDKIDGVKARHKYRIRIYNDSDRVIRLERKSKLGDYISKVSAPITRNLAEQIIAGDAYGLERLDHPLLQDLYRQMTLHLLRPAVIVDYVRKAFVHPAENTRVTLDQRLRTGLFSLDLFNPKIPTIPCLHEETVVLEIKYDRRFPAFIRPMVSSVPALRSAISKYTICRRFEFNL